jgi:hypothetical protein
MKTRKLGRVKKTKQVEQPEAPYFYTLPDEMIDKIGFYLSPKDKFPLSRVGANFHAFFQPDLDKTALLQAVVHDKKQRVKKILDAKPELLLAEPSNLVIENKYTGQKFCDAEALKWALMRGQIEMVRLILPYFEKLEKRDVIEDGKKEAQRQWDEVSDAISKQEKNLDHIIQPLVTVLSKETLSNGSKDDKLIDRISEETITTFSEFVKKILPDEAFTLDNYVDTEKLLVAAHNVFGMQCHTFQDQNQREIFQILVINFLQSVQNPELVKALWKNLYNELYFVTEKKSSISVHADSLMAGENKTLFDRVLQKSLPEQRADIPSSHTNWGEPVYVMSATGHLANMFAKEELKAYHQKNSSELHLLKDRLKADGHESKKRSRCVIQ